MRFVTRSALKSGGNRNIAVLAAVAALASGCSSSKPPAKPNDALQISPPPVAAIPTLGGVDGLVLPSQAYMPTPEQQQVVEEAEEQLIVTCMSDFGFTWTARPAPPSENNQFDHLYGLVSMQDAQTSGYHTLMIAQDPRRQSGAPTITYSPAELLVYSGSTNGDSNPTPPAYQGKQIPPGGCSGKARDEVTGVDQIDPNLLANQVAVNAFNLSKSDQRVVAVVGDWSACMKQAGYQYDSPLSVGDPSWANSPEPSQSEIQTAVTDVTCKQQTNLIGVWFTVEAAYENVFIQRDIEKLASIKRAWDQAARKAAQILGVAAPQA